MLQMRVSFRRFRLIVSLYSHNVYTYYSKIVLVAIQDEGSRFGPAAFDALRRLGATDPILNDYRGSYALAGFSGINKPSWVTQQQANSGKGPSEISLKVTIGKYISTELYNSTFKSDAIIFFPGMHAPPEEVTRGLFEESADFTDSDFTSSDFTKSCYKCNMRSCEVYVKTTSSVSACSIFKSSFRCIAFMRVFLFPLNLKAKVFFLSSLAAWPWLLVNCL